ncbi:unnamed protein product [Sphagnum jensenii]|jgi:hypothetical protein|uniref:Uncharacterized protein n=1 Tax=Sphagnum jensenii TaxID=128206 RepID=A0ABP0X1H9_9BRYO
MDTPIAVDLINPVCEEHPNSQLVVVVVTTPNHHKFCIGFSPVDVRGRPLLDLSKTGGWRAAFFIFGMSKITKPSSQGLLYFLGKKMILGLGLGFFHFEFCPHSAVL